MLKYPMMNPITIKLLLAVKKEVGGHGANTDGYVRTHVSVAATVVVLFTDQLNLSCALIDQ